VRRLLIAAVVAGCGGHHSAPPPVHAAATEPEPVVEDLSARLEPIRAAEQLPALGMAVWRGGTLIAIGVAGQRKNEEGTAAVTVDDQWHLGSDTKAMTATLIGIYVDRGVLHWDDTVATLFAGATIDPGYAKVTLDQLLGHRGGAPEQPPAALWKALVAGRTTDEPAHARAVFVDGVLAQPPAQPPGTYAYSNAGYMIAGAALERATGKTWEQLMVADLFAPLGMASCGFGPPGHTDLLDQPWGHETKRIGDTVTPYPMEPDDPSADNPPALGPAGAVHCSLRDWGKFLTLHAAATSTLVSDATFAHLHQPLAGDGAAYGFGWLFATPHPGDTRFVHEGSNTMWDAIALVVPVIDEAIAIVANRQDDTLFTAMVPVMQRYLTPAPR
jgi:CubicO group peptidase (beta-lactamase class C family)